jgi:hypothetical protein
MDSHLTPDSMPPAPPGPRALQWILAFVCICILAALIAIMTWALHWHIETLDRVSNDLLKRPGIPSGSLLMFIGIANFAILKTCALCFAFVLIFLGSMYVLWPGRASFALEAEQADTKASLRTSSPGLVMIALGVLLTALVVFYKANLSMSEASQPIAATADKQPIDVGTPRNDFKESSK